jgi:GGDEF domain-containing protein
MQRLRHQVDRFGHVRVGGAVAVVLPKLQVSTGQAIDDAVGLIEHHVRPSDVIGTIGGSGAGVLLADATRDVASAVVGRLLQAARQKLVGVRVGVAMFAASTESPESVLERALMNARRGSAV